jgi:hypothetical protein
MRPHNSVAGHRKFFSKRLFLFFETQPEFWPSERTEGGITIFRERPSFRDDPVAHFRTRVPSSKQSTQHPRFMKSA